MIYWVKMGEDDCHVAHRSFAHDESEITKAEDVLKQSKETLASHMEALAAANARLAKLDELLKDIAAEKATAK